MVGYIPCLARGPKDRRRRRIPEVRSASCPPTAPLRAFPARARTASDPLAHIHLPRRSQLPRSLADRWVRDSRRAVTARVKDAGGKASGAAAAWTRQLVSKYESRFTEAAVRARERAGEQARISTRRATARAMEALPDAANVAGRLAASALGSTAQRVRRGARYGAGLFLAAVFVYGVAAATPGAIAQYVLHREERQRHGAASPGEAREAGEAGEADGGNVVAPTPARAGSREGDSAWHSAGATAWSAGVAAAGAAQRAYRSLCATPPQPPDPGASGGQAGGENVWTGVARWPADEAPRAAPAKRWRW